MSSTTVRPDRPAQLSPSESPLQPFGNPGNPTEPVLDESPIHERKIAALPRHVREKEPLGKTLTQVNRALVLNSFHSLVASPATPHTPTPVSQLGSGHSSGS